MRLYAHLNFGGNCEEAFRFYEKHLGGRITLLMRQRELPPGQKPPPGSTDDAVIHVRLQLPAGELVGNDVPASYFKPIRSSYVGLELDSPEEVERVYAVFAEGGEVGIPLQETFFAPRFAQLRDQFGTLWTILHRKAA